MYVQNSLSAAQSSAEKWRAGLAGFVSLVTAGLLIKGPESASDLQWGWRLALTILLGGGLLAAIAGLWMALRAAAGDAKRSSLDEVINTYGSIDAMQVFQAGEATRYVGYARKFVAASLLLLSAGSISWWWATKSSSEPAAYLQVTSPAGTECGELTSADGGKIVLKVPGQSVPAAITTKTVTNMQVVASCPAR